MKPKSMLLSTTAVTGHFMKIGVFVALLSVAVTMGAKAQENSFDPRIWGYDVPNEGEPMSAFDHALDDNYGAIKSAIAVTSIGAMVTAGADPASAGGLSIWFVNFGEIAADYDMGSLSAENLNDKAIDVAIDVAVQTAASGGAAALPIAKGTIGGEALKGSVIGIIKAILDGGIKQDPTKSADDLASGAGLAIGNGLSEAIPGLKPAKPAVNGAIVGLLKALFNPKNHIEINGIPVGPGGGVPSGGGGGVGGYDPGYGGSGGDSGSGWGDWGSGSGGGSGGGDVGDKGSDGSGDDNDGDSDGPEYITFWADILDEDGNVIGGQWMTSEVVVVTASSENEDPTGTTGSVGPGPGGYADLIANLKSGIGGGANAGGGFSNDGFNMLDFVSKVFAEGEWGSLWGSPIGGQIGGGDEGPDAKGNPNPVGYGFGISMNGDWVAGGFVLSGAGGTLGVLDFSGSGFTGGKGSSGPVNDDDKLPNPFDDNSPGGPVSIVDLSGTGLNTNAIQP